MRILLAVDGSPASQDAVDFIAERPWPQGTTVRVLSVVTPYVPGATEFVSGAETPLEVITDHEGDARRLATHAANHLKLPLTVEVTARQGDPAKTIVDEATQWDADLIVVGSHGRSTLERLLVGSVARSVVDHAPCSVEVVRRRQPAA